MDDNTRVAILVVDDYALNRRLLIDILGPLGFEVREAANGRDALEALKSHAPDLIIMDTLMPVMNGLEATRLIRSTQGIAHIPIIALSANDAPQDAARNRAAGANAVLKKPLDVKQLLQVINEQLAQRRAADAADPR